MLFRSLSRAVAPVWLASPYEVATIADSMPFDAVILVDAGATTLAENVGAIRRARQVVVFGDPVTQTPAAFEVSIDPGESAPSADELDDDRLGGLHDQSALARLGSLLPTFFTVILSGSISIT